MYISIDTDLTPKIQDFNRPVKLPLLMKTFDSLAACKYVYRVREIRSIVITARIINICAKEYISGPWY